MCCREIARAKILPMGTKRRLFVVVSLLTVLGLYVKHWTQEIILETEIEYMEQSLKVHAASANGMSSVTYGPVDATIAVPVILWWTPHFGRKYGELKKCSKGRCFLTENRNYYNYSQTEVIMFYGTDFKLLDLPLPRLPPHQWALLHEESPKNSAIFSYKGMMKLFNHTSTFRRQSDYPVTTQFLSNLAKLSSQEFTTTLATKNSLLRSGQRAPLIYVHTDCDVPSDRDSVASMLMKHVDIDSYGTCLHNKDLPLHLKNPVGGMDHPDFFRLVGTYKFALAMENALCEDYITEKFWRPLIAGSIPIVLGSNKVKDFAPTIKSIIDISDFKSIAKLAQYIEYLNSNDTAYSEYLSFKDADGITNSYLKSLMQRREWDADWGLQMHEYTPDRKPFYIDRFECHVCDRLHEHRYRTERGEPEAVRTADKDHYGCPLPTDFIDANDLNRKKPSTRFWRDVWKTAYFHLQAFLSVSDGGRKAFTSRALERTALKMQKEATKQDFD